MKRQVLALWAFIGQQIVAIGSQRRLVLHILKAQTGMVVLNAELVV
jgi:hypothetical protein